ncbi:MAG TPA: hypothetical protein VMV38_01290 [Candidatus Paceibacterota bacterium]|nr:hypothetical protein [Candidatus Paceibacterota bacterium]
MPSKRVLKTTAWVVIATAVALLLFACVLMFSSVPAHAAQTEFQWKNFGAAPYASTRAEAMRMRESAFRKLDLPQPVIALFMKATTKPGEKVRLVNGNRLSVMLSKGGIAHRNVLIAFTKPPVSGKMEYAAPAEEWQVSWQGKIYTIILPEICNNWSVKILPAMATCPEIRVTVNPGDTVLNFILLGGVPPMSASCPFGYKPPGSRVLYTLPTECPSGFCDFSETIASSGMASGPSGGIDVSRKPGVYTFQVSREFARDQNRIAAFCITVASGAHSCAKDIRPADYYHQLAVIGWTIADKPTDWLGTIRIWCFPTNGPCGECR